MSEFRDHERQGGREDELFPDLESTEGFGVTQKSSLDYDRIRRSHGEIVQATLGASRRLPHTAIVVNCQFKFRT